MRRFAPWLVLVLLAAAGAWLLRDALQPEPPAAGGDRADEPSGEEPLTLIGRGDDLRLGGVRLGEVSVAPDLSDLGSDDPPFEIAVLGEDGKPVASAQVTVVAPRLGSRFAPEQQGPLRLGRRWLRAGAEVRVEAAKDAHGHLLPLRPTVVSLKDLEARRVEVRLERGRDLEVQVFDEAGSPVAGASVHVVSADPNDDARALFWNTSTWANTDARGVASFVRLPRRALVVRVEGDVEQEPLAQAEVGPQAVRETISLRAGPVVQGRVTDEHGSAVADAHVVATGWEKGQEVEWSARTDRDGRFRIRHVPPGVEVRVEARAPDTGRLVAAVVGGVQAGGPDVLLTLGSAVEIRGEVVDATGEKAFEWQVEAIPLDADRDRPAASGDESSTRFTLAGLLPGRYRVHARSKASASAEHRGQVVGGARPVDVTAPADGVRLVLERTPRVVGHVEGSRGARYDAWWSTGSRGAGSSKRSSRVDPDGSFEIPDVQDAVGTLYVGSLSTNRYALLRDVRPGGPPLEITLREGEAVSGRVRVAEGTHAGLVYVVLDGDGFELWEEADAEGRFTMLGVPPGAYDVSLVVNEKRGPVLQRVRAGASDLVLAYAPPR